MITYERLLEIIDYDSLTGIFTRKVKVGRNCRLDKPLGRLNTRGYLDCKIESKIYSLHRLAWFYVTKNWPIDQIDHINCIKTDNRFENLREATRSQNMCNKNKMKHNKSGYKGVYWDKQSSKWKAQITINKVQKCIGSFDDPLEAHNAYCNAAKELHTEFHNLG